LLGGLVVTILGLATGRELTNVLFDLLIVLIVFYVLGLVLKTYLLKKVFPPSEDEFLSDEFLASLAEDSMEDAEGEGIDVDAIFADEEKLTENSIQ